MLRCLLLSRVLTSTHKLRRAIKQSIELVIPLEIAKPIVELIDSNVMKFPDKASLSRFHFVLDSAYMVYNREAHGPVMEGRIPPARSLVLEHRRSMLGPEFPNKV